MCNYVVLFLLCHLRGGGGGGGASFVKNHHQFWVIYMTGTFGEVLAVIWLWKPQISIFADESFSI